MSFNYPQLMLKSIRLSSFLLCFFLFQGITFASHADLELTMTSPNSSPGIFANVDIEITITNHGPETTENVLLEFPFPTDLPITGDPVESQGFFSEWWTGTGVWTVGTLASGQTETVTVKLFTLAEDLYFYGQVVNSSIVDDDSTPSNGTAPIPNEDDEAVVLINDTGGGNCELTTFVGNISCDDNGSPNDPTDDIFSFTFTAHAQNTSSVNWNAQLPFSGGNITVHPFSFPYYVTLTEAAAQTLPNRIYEFTVQDPSISTCFEIISVLIPAPCSAPNPCNIAGSTINVQCFDGGTPNNPDDDQWSFDLIADGTNTSANWMAIINNQTYTGNYGQPTSLGLFPIADGHVFVELMDSGNPACTDAITVSAPPVCSNGGNQCSISATIVSVDCNTMGNTNPNDDTWSFIVDVNGTNTSNTWMAPFQNGFYSGTYAQNYSRQNLPLTGPQTITQVITDSADPNCSTTITIDAPFPCNNVNKPDLELTMTSNAQPGAFQNISYELTVTNTGTAPANGVAIDTELPENVVLQGGNECDATGGNANCIVNHVSWFFTTIAPGQSETLTVNFFTLASGNITFYAQVQSMNNEDEDSTPSNGTPPTVNEDDEAVFTIGDAQPCQISGPFLTNIECFDNGTPLQADDYFNFEIMVNGNGSAYNLTTNAGVNGVFNYGQTIPVTGFLYADLPFSIAANDVNDPSCFFTQENNGSFQPCSFGTDCTIFYDNVSKVCDDNGTPNSADDTYIIQLTASAQGVDAGTGWTVNHNGQTYSGTYGQIGNIGPFLINDGNFSLTVQDNQNPDCNTVLLSLPPPPCSTGGGGDTDLKLEVTSNTIFAGSNVVVYTVTITNEGVNDASGVSLQFYQGNSFGIIDFELSTGSFSYSTDIWSVGTIAAGTSETIILDDQYVDFSAGNLPTYPFFEILTMDGNDPDSTPGNDNGDHTADEDDEAILAIFPNGMGGWPSDLSVNLTTPSTNIDLGETFEITFSIDLDDGGASNDVAAELVLPPTLQYQSHTASQGTFNSATGNWEVGYIGGLSNAELVVTVTLISNAPTNVVFGQLTAATFDLDSTPNNGGCCMANEDDEAVLTIGGGSGNGVDLELDVTSNSTYQAWNFMTFEINLTNNGTAPATGVKVQVFEIQGGIYQGGNEGSATAGVFNGTNAGASFWNLNGVTIAPGQTEVLTINCFMFNDGGIQTWAQVWEQNETDIDSAPGNGFPFSIQEDDEDSGLLTGDGFSLVAQNTNQLNAKALNSNMLIQNIYPNPVTDNLTVAIISMEASNAILQISNAQGCDLQAIENQVQQGKNILEMNVSNLPRGIYFLKIETEDGMEVQRFLKN